MMRKAGRRRRTEPRTEYRCVSMAWGDRPTVRVLEGSCRRSAKLVRGQRKPGCSPPPTKAARFCSRREESIGLVVLHRCPLAGGHRARLGANSEAVRFESFAFGSIQIDGKTYDHDVVLDRGAIRKRHKKASRQLRSAYGHTPLSLSEKIPWDCRRLVVGTGAQGALPLVPELRREAETRGVELVSLPTAGAIALLEKDSEGTNAILHVTW